MPSVGSKIKSTMRTVPYRFQVRGVRLLDKLGGRAVLGDDMGLGKTYQAIAYAAVTPETKRVLVVCPSYLKYNWQNEMRDHAGQKAQVLSAFKRYGLCLKIWKAKKGQGESRQTLRWFPTADKATRFLALSQTKKRMMLLKKTTRRPPRLSDRVIVNYDILEDWVEVLLEHRFDLVVLDECHYIKNRSALRTKLCSLLAKQSPKVIGASGTPIMSKPVEFFPILHLVAPKLFPSFWQYAMRYCKPRRGWRGRGWVFNGVSNLAELRELLGTVLIRRTKAEVLKDLPLKRRTVLPVDIHNRADYDAAKEDFVKWLRKNKGKKAAKKAKRAVAVVRLGALKRLAAEGKTGSFLVWIQDWLEQTDRKLVVFCIHKAIIACLRKAFPAAAVISGATPMPERQRQVDRFQQDKKCRLFFGNIDAAGTGVTLHAASAVLILELPWVPTKLDQAEDRVNRIGQTANSIDIYYMVAKDTVEQRMLSVLDDKRQIVQQVLDGKEVEDVDLLNELIKDVMRK